jgi:hypothetical protein
MEDDSVLRSCGSNLTLVQCALNNITAEGDSSGPANQFLDEDDYEYINNLFTYFGEGVLLTAVSSFGLVGNMMSICVLTRSINSRGSRQGTG